MKILNLIPSSTSWMDTAEDFCPSVTDRQTELSQDTQPPDLPSVSGIRLQSYKESSWCDRAPRAQASPHPVPPGCGAQPCDDPLVAQTVKNLPALQETQVRSLGWEDPLEKGMATHSSILAWRIPQTEKPGGLWFVGLQRVGHD